MLSLNEESRRPGRSTNHARNFDQVAQHYSLHSSDSIHFVRGPGGEFLERIICRRNTRSVKRIGETTAHNTHVAAHNSYTGIFHSSDQCVALPARGGNCARAAHRFILVGSLCFHHSQHRVLVHEFSSLGRRRRANRFCAPVGQRTD